MNYKTLASYYFCKVFEVYGSDNHPEAIINMDEMDMPLEPSPPKVVMKERYQTSGQKQGCGSTTGHVIPPFFEFGSCFVVSDNGWVDHM